jgi:hypothetical protein
MALKAAFFELFTKMTGNPEAFASRITFGNPSLVDGKTKIFDAFMKD